MLKRAQSIAQQIVAWRRHIHQHPELSFQEVQTAQYVADQLAAMGITARTGVGKTGVVADLGEGDLCVALRADMDALPMQEENDVPYASVVPGVMHSCGHDTHVAGLLGAAQLLAKAHKAGQLPGRVRLLFQPSEEKQDDKGLSGAMRMVDEGVMDGVDAVFGLHVWADLPVGQVAIREGISTAYPDKFTIVIKGKDGHGAYPHLGVDAIAIAAQVINALQLVITRRLDPTRGKVITVGTIQGGTKDNIMTGRVTMTGTIRTFEPEVRETLFEEMDQACKVAQALGGDYELTIERGYIPVVNDPAMTDLVRQVSIDLVGEDKIIEGDQEMGGEDFSYFQEKAPGCFFMIGGAAPGEPPRLHHHPRFDVDEACLPLGAALLAEIAIRFLRQEKD